MSEMDRIVEQSRQVHEGEAWHLREAVRRLPAARLHDAVPGKGHSLCTSCWG